ncbi:MAG: TPM domain-containing protein [Chloroflexi bacterium]|nr:TPM domain-containing protein [Chloroflexota bacterium]
MRRLRALSALLLLFAVLAGVFAAGPALAAEDIPRLGGPVTDQTGTLRGDEARVERAIVDLRSASAIDLWVLFVETTSPLSITDYAKEVASRNSLGTNDVLLVVAMEDRTDALWVSNSLDDITDAEIDAIIGNDLEPRLSSGDFAGAVEATARGLAGAAGVAVATPSPTRPTASTTPRPTATAGGGPSPGGDSGGGGFGIIVPLILLVIGSWIVFAWWRRRSADRRTAEEPDKQTGGPRRGGQPAPDRDR